jgi:putative hydrolase of the HAD superfamily
VTPTAVGFDLDHTLAVPDRDRRRILAAAIDDVDAPAVSRAAYLAAHRDDHAAVTRTPIFASVLPADADVSPAALAGAYRRRIAESIAPVEGVADVLHELRANYPVGLLTNGPVKAQSDKLSELDWWDAFDAVQITGQLPAGKPDRRAFDALAGALGVDVEELAYVGDEPTADVEGATNAGAMAVQVVWPDGPDPHPRANAVVERDRLASDLPDVLEALP